MRRLDELDALEEEGEKEYGGFWTRRLQWKIAIEFDSDDMDEEVSTFNLFLLDHRSLFRNSNVSSNNSIQSWQFLRTNP